MTVYERIDNIPYETIRKGGHFQVNILPNEMKQEGLGMAVLPGEAGITIPWLIAFVGLLLGTICTVVVVQSIGGLVATIKAVPEGKIIDTLPNGGKILQTPDGSTILLNPDGTTEKLSDPPSNITASIIAVVLVAVFAFVIITLAVPFMKGVKLTEVTPKKKKKP